MPNEEITYRQNVSEKIDNLQNVLEIRMNTFERDTRDSLSRIEVTQVATNAKLDFTNGKVRKMIIGMVLLAGIVIGQTLSPKEIVSFLAGMI